MKTFDHNQNNFFMDDSFHEIMESLIFCIFIQNNKIINHENQI